MLFSSIEFLYYFLPILLICYYIANKQYRNYILLVFSLFFYGFGEPIYIGLMVTVVFINYLLGLLLGIGKYKKLWVGLSVVFNLSVLGYFKYANFFIENINGVFDMSLSVKKVVLPIGISFYIFQAMSYIIDVYRDDAKVQKKFTDLALYISLFPQLIAGPIVRYNTIEEQLTHRTETYEKFYEGMYRFIIGLGKKLIIANNMAYIADMAFNSTSTNSVVFAWIGALCYTYQIYFDFSGYSDMAIGLGKMFGFEFLENFNYPYIAESVTDFWRRWHMSLGAWFRDYVYIPLGGNRKGTLKSIFNVCVVWFLTGFWHGASWNFILWGCYFGALLLIEKYILKDILKNINIWVRRAGTFILAIFGWVLFRAETLTDVKSYLSVMLGLSDNPFTDKNVQMFLENHIFFFIIAVIFAMPYVKEFFIKISTKTKYQDAFFIFKFVALGLLFYISTTYTLASDFNPFIYFNF